MLKIDKYYYSDATFQLEINLHKVRQELIAMLEYEHTHCETNKCITDPHKTSDTINGKSDNKRTSNKISCINTIKDPSAEDALQPKLDKNDQSPAPSTPEKLTVTKDIEAWMETSKKLDSYTEKVILNTKKSLVTIESVRPADLPLKTLQRSSILNSTSLLTNPNPMNSSTLLNSQYLNSASVMNSQALEAYLKYLKPQLSDTQVVYMSAKLAAACKKQIVKQNYSYF